MLDTTPITQLERYRGCLLAGAAGDALGAAVEFDDVATIQHRFGPAGILDPAAAYGRVGAITDDTQMTLFTAEGVLQADDRLQRGVGNPPGNVWYAYQRWLRTQGETNPWHQEVAQLHHGELHQIAALRSRRAPGNTCLGALRTTKIEWDGEYPIAANTSKGCGGVMRAAPCGLVDWGEEHAFKLGVASAALTHGHPSGHLAAGALATIICKLCDGRPLTNAVDAAIATVSQHGRSDEVTTALQHARRLAATADHTPDVSVLGRGWVAEEALAIAVYCALTQPEDLTAALRMAANHSGDSDSTAAIAGNIMGALLGAQAIPPRWLEVLELRDTIDRLATAMHDRFVMRRDRVDWKLWNYACADGDYEAPAPRHDAYWVTPGRLLAGPYPGAKYGVEAKGKLHDFLELGVTCFVDLTEEHEGLEPYAALLRELAARRGIQVTHLRMPIRDNDVVPAWRMRAIQDTITRALDADEIVYVHCWGGVGRTGTVIGCHLVEHAAQNGNQALSTLKHLRRATQRARRTSPETSPQRAVVRAWQPA